MKKEFLIAKFVKNNRKKLKITQVELSRLTGVGLRFVKEVENGKMTVRVDKVNQILKLFGHILIPSSIKKIKENS